MVLTNGLLGGPFAPDEDRTITDEFEEREEFGRPRTAPSSISEYRHLGRRRFSAACQVRASTVSMKSRLRSALRRWMATPALTVAPCRSKLSTMCRSRHRFRGAYARSFRPPKIHA